MSKGKSKELRGAVASPIGSLWYNAEAIKKAQKAVAATRAAEARAEAIAVAEPGKPPAPIQPFSITLPHLVARALESDMEVIVVLAWAGLLHAKPELTPEEAEALITPEIMCEVIFAVQEGVVACASGPKGLVGLQAFRRATNAIGDFAAALNPFSPDSSPGETTTTS